MYIIIMPEWVYNVYALSDLLFIFYWVKKSEILKAQFDC